MAEDDNYISLQSIRMLQLFPVRKTQCLDFDLEKFKKLYEVLTCSFCRQIFNNPTYLRCSHRFCKECIEKHIRKNDKKSCPVCRGELTTKRDTKSDLKLISLISFAFGDPVGMQNQIDKYQEEAVKNIKFVKTKSGIEMELKRDRPESLDHKLKNLQGSSRKRTNKDVEEEQAQGKKGEEKRKVLIEKQTTPKLEDFDKQKQKQEILLQMNKPDSQQAQKQVAQQNSQTQQQKKNIKVNWGNTKGKQKMVNKKKKAEIIEILSEGSNEVEASRSKVPEEPELSVNSSKQPESNKLSNAKKDTKATIEIEGKKDTNQVSVTVSQPLQEVSSIINQQTIAKPRQFELVVEPKSQQLFFKQGKFDQDLITVRNKLKENLGNNYLTTLIRKSSKPCSIRLQLAPEPKSMTPGLKKPFIQLTLQIKLGDLKQYIFSKLNLQHKITQPEKVVQLSISTKQNAKQILAQASLTLLDLLSTHWKDYKGINFYDIHSSLSSKSHTENSKVLYYKIKHNQIQHTNKNKN